MDMTWLAEEARKIHDLFSGLFYSLVCLLLLIVHRRTSRHSQANAHDLV
jgi:hypothetical protein